MTALPARDLEHVLDLTAGLWTALRGQRIFVTGGTGFFGRWLVETFVWAEQRLALGAQLHLLTRDPARFLASAPHLVNAAAIQLVRGSLDTFEYPPGEFTHVIHAAAVVPNTAAPAELHATWNTLVAGTQQVLDFAQSAHASKLLFISSGAVYGRQPPEVAQMPETYSGAPDPLQVASSYGEGKRAGELLCALYAQGSALEVKIARCFAFVGPGMPLDAQFAIGNFVRDGLATGPIQVADDGTALRSYLYAADLSIWLWTILLQGQNLRPYNVGSAQAMTILEVAQGVARQFAPAPAIHVAQLPTPNQPPARYIPDVRRAETELGLRQTIGFDDAVQRTIAWYRQ